MTQIEALKMLHFIARQDGPSHDDLLAFGEKDAGLLAHAKRRDQALSIVDDMITAMAGRKQKRQHRQIPKGISC